MPLKILIRNEIWVDWLRCEEVRKEFQKKSVAIIDGAIGLRVGAVRGQQWSHSLEQPSCAHADNSRFAGAKFCCVRLYELEVHSQFFFATNNTLHPGLPFLYRRLSIHTSPWVSRKEILRRAPVFSRPDVLSVTPSDLASPTRVSNLDWSLLCGYALVAKQRQ